MSVLLETTFGDIVIDLFYKDCPLACYNFIKLCKIKYYNNSLFHEVQRDFLTISGIPTTPSHPSTDTIQSLLEQHETTSVSLKEMENIAKSSSIYQLKSDQIKNRFFSDEICSKFKHNRKGIVSSANIGPNLNTSLFFITLSSHHLQRLDGKHTVFGCVEEGFEVLDKINRSIVNENNQPLYKIRIKHTVIIDDPFPDDSQIQKLIPVSSPKEIKEIEEEGIEMEDILNQVSDETRFVSLLKEHEIKTKTIALTILDDVVDSSKSPSENVLFICKLNSITHENDIKEIFSKYGKVVSVKIIKDKTSFKSLGYGFIEYERKEECELAYKEMNGAYIDDRRIKLDFSQSSRYVKESGFYGKDRNKTIGRKRSRSRSRSR